MDGGDVSTSIVTDVEPLKTPGGAVICALAPNVSSEIAPPSCVSVPSAGAATTV